MELHEKHLELVMELLEQHQFYANEKKCSLGSKKISYLGHVISGDGVSADPEKVAAMVIWPQLKNITELRVFFGTHWILQEVCGWLW